MLPPNLRPIIRQIDQAIEKTESRADDRSKRAEEAQKNVALAVDRLADEFETYQAKQNESERKKNRRENLTIFSLIVTAAITLALAVLAYLQWQTFEKQWLTLEKTDQTLRLQSRAWIAPRRLVAPDNFKAAAPIDKYTEITVRFENVGKEPAIKTTEVVATEALPVDDFRKEEALKPVIQKMLDGRTCDSIPIDPNGRAIFPGGTPGTVVGFEEEKVAKINKRKHYALVVGCFVYETL